MTKKKKTALVVVQVPINDLKPSEYNPRQINEQKLSDLKNSLKKFGFADVITVNSAPNRKNIVIGGHMRLKAAKELNFKKIPVIYVNLPDIKSEKELNLRLNKNTGEWDYDLLQNFDMDMLLGSGFDEQDLGSIWNSLLETEDDDFQTEKELEKIKKIYVKSGDLFALGKHRLICGDSTDIEIVKKLMDGEKTTMINSDPPFNINLDYSKGISGKNNYGGKTNDKKTEEEYFEFIKQTITNGLSVLSKDAHIFYYCDQNYIGMIQTLYSNFDIKSKRVCMWIKNGFNVTPQVAFNKSYEPCVYGTIGKPYLSPKANSLSELMNKEISAGNRAIDDIMDIIDIWLVKRLPGQDYKHPTSKPPTLHEKALNRCTRVNDIVLDLFGGSGSTLIACEQLKRRAYLVEIEPIFTQLIIKRYEELTGQKAKRLN